MLWNPKSLAKISASLNILTWTLREREKEREQILSYILNLFIY